ncbi:unnamed protein product [Peronospora belbahrii]|uniref:Transcription initiation factor TFIID subunit 10 n=1 Tax=Peronospora belbahrii TaxID=622444 RepID=A0AAU9L2Y2_9STRA|nr:unnamed protein product [Peronospora belbahrii]CAH0520209.1 unnamed protein product [Peronospora belbahrii]
MAEAAQLDAVLAAMTQYTPTIPDELVEFYLHQTGFVTNDTRIIRLISLVVHKFLLDVTHDAMQYQRIRSQNTSSVTTSTATASLTSGQIPDGTYTSGSHIVLTMEDLAASLKEYGVNICRPEYVSDVAYEPTM